MAHSYLKSVPKDNEKFKSLIIMVYNFNRQRLKYSTGELIDHTEWNPEKQRARKGHESLNRYLDRLDRMVKEARLKILADGTHLSTGALRDELNRMLDKGPARETFIQFIDRYIKECNKKPTSITIFKTVLTHLKSFSLK